jgi:hypothetical protein
VPVRRFFEPTDMEFEEPGMAELDMPFGLVRGEDAYRVSAPDFEFDLGLTSNLELDIDGEFAVGGPDTGEFTFDRTAPDNLWTSLKAGLLDFGDEANAWTSGIQLGPKLPLAHGNQGVGVEGLLLLGWRVRQTQLVLTLRRSGPSAPVLPNFERILLARMGYPCLSQSSTFVVVQDRRRLVSRLAAVLIGGTIATTRTGAQSRREME